MLALYIVEFVAGWVGVPSLFRTFTLPRTCSTHFWASSFFWISLTAASACLTAAVAVANRPPHHPPFPPPPPATPACFGDSAGGGGLLSSAAAASSDVGVSPWWNERVLSADFLGGGATGRDVSPLLRAELVDVGVAASRLLVPASFGVWGRLGGFAFARLSSSANGSSARGAWAAGTALDAFDGGLAGAEVVVFPMPSNWASSSSSVRAFFWAMASQA